LEQRDSSKTQIRKGRKCFIYENQYFQVETFLNIPGYPSIMRVETTKESQKIKIPSFLEVLREVTLDSNYQTWIVAGEKYAMPQEDCETIQQKIVEGASNSKPKSP